MTAEPVVPPSPASPVEHAICETCAAAMPPQITGPLARAAFEESTHLGVLIRRQLGDEWADVYLELQSGFFAFIEEFDPDRFTR